jgi:putative ABC transport system permease protein
MFIYNLRLAWLSIKKNPVLSALMVSAIAIGISVCMTIMTVYKLMANDPIPHKSEQIFTTQLDLRDLDADESGDPPQYMSYVDATNLLKSDIPTKSSVHYQSIAIIKSENQDIRPFRAVVRLATADFFGVTDAPFKYGEPWSHAEEDQLNQLVVLSDELNNRLFGGADSTGQKIELAGKYYKVIGVLEKWTPTPRYFELDGGSFVETEGAFIPFSLTPSLGLQKSGGSIMCLGSPMLPGWNGFLRNDCAWLHMWVQLDTPEQQQQWQQHVDNYVLDQQQLGRFPRPLNNKMHDVMSWLEDAEVVDSDYIMLLGLAFMFLGVCLFNTVGLMLSQALQKRGEISVRRALGGSQRVLFNQAMVEALIIGLAGGLFGLVLANLSLSGVRQLYSGFELVTQMNWQLVAITFALAVLSSLLASLYPTWRVCRLPPAQYLKTQ